MVLSHAHSRSLRGRPSTVIRQSVTSLERSMTLSRAVTCNPRRKPHRVSSALANRSVKHRLRFPPPWVHGCVHAPANAFARIVRMRHVSAFCIRVDGQQDENGLRSSQGSKQRDHAIVRKTPLVRTISWADCEIQLVGGKRAIPGFGSACPSSRCDGETSEQLVLVNSNELNITKNCSGPRKYATQECSFGLVAVPVFDEQGAACSKAEISYM